MSKIEGMTGYLHPAYANSLAEFGTPRELPACGGWILERSIPHREERDAMGCYPLFACRKWRNLPQDLAEIGKDLVTLALVTDPFADVCAEFLQQQFDIAKPFKNHYVADLSRPLEELINRHHRYYARRSLRHMEVEVCLEPVKYLAEWTHLYGNLIERHHIRGIRAFSEESFRRQLTTPGMILFVGKRCGEILGAHLVAVQNTVAYSHLAAFSPVGYEQNAAYGIYWNTWEYLAERGICRFDLGAAAGLDTAVDDGLDRFKRGWSAATRMVYFCGKVFDRERYAAIRQSCRSRETDYFPAYRAGKFG